MTATKLLSREKALGKIVQAITPYLGQTMAAAAVELHRQKLGIDGGLLPESRLDELLARIGTGLIIFVGREKSQQIMRDARAVAILEDNRQ